ncbi:hypothetical protein EJ04DRAFT_572290 [Polyplosphaeria fusca]|uniref:RING-type domain-containing protein n=1 Tax=Polyplosphaeria fusca TaxID=682080 RepID=A0A9P4R741_9PLEO|nr:hypothetical protein EJ04DRAFT_572290 [Polyplosphaeria fusca]
MMNPRPSATPPAAARPKNSASSITSTHASTTPHLPASSASSSKTARGGTPTANRQPTKAPSGDMATRPTSRDSLKQKLAKKPEEKPKPSKSEQQLQTLRSDVDGLRSHLTCKICDRLLYQPYIISCGHTYCYSCLCTWFVSNKSRKTCPDCRAVVTQAPAPAYIIRDMTSIFIAKVELLPAGETIDQHRKWQQEEADLVQQDKDNKDPRTGGLFKGCFRLPRPSGPSLRVVRDQEDGVDRCPMCSWELEEHACPQCGLFFDDNGDVTWGDSFAGFSDDMDELSERSMSGEDLDGEIDMDDVDVDFDGYDEPMEGWQDYLGEGAFMMRRFLEHGYPPQGPMGRRRPWTHSEAGSRRSYTHSIVSDMFTDGMDTVEEEEEEEDGLDEDSSMNDFVVNENASTSSTSAASTPAPTPQPSNAQGRARARARPVVESEASSSVSSSIEEEDEEDQGPIRRGQRNRAQARLLNRANGSREPSGPPSSTSTEASHEQELDEDTQRLLQADGWMLQHDGPDEEMEDDDSDGGRTTVGWDATANNERLRMGGSLTPTADRPRPNAPIRPPSRTGNTRLIDTSRGLRRRSSVLSVSTYNHDDAEADDDNSDLDQDGDMIMAMNALRSQQSRAQLRNSGGFRNSGSRSVNRGPAQRYPVDLDDDDDLSDSSLQPGRRRSNQHGNRHEEYIPRISWMFADHQRALQEYERGGSLIDQEARSTTPIARPRTANRNRQSPAPAFSPFIAPAPPRMRTPGQDHLSNNPSLRGPTSPPSRIGATSAQGHSVLDGSQRTDRAASVSSSSNSSVIFTPGTATPVSQISVNAISQAQVAAAADMIDRPPSRVSARPPSVNSRRTSPGFSPVYQGFPHPAVGLNIAANRMIQRGNPWGAFVQQPQGVRPRTSRPVLRDQSSTATLRAANSRANIREGVTPSQGIRSQGSRADLRHQPSRRRLNNQASTRTLRASEHGRPPPSPNANAPPAGFPSNRPSRMTTEERESAVRDLINRRTRALEETYLSTSNRNPFAQAISAQAIRRPSMSSETPPVSAGTAVQHVRSSSNESFGSANSTSTAQGAPPSPQLARRRSTRNIGGAPPVMSPTQATFSPPPTAYTTNYLRARQGSLSYDTPLNVAGRGLSPMVTAGNSGPLI